MRTFTKLSLLFCAWILSMAVANAQQEAIYFASGKAKLEKEAIQSLEKLIETCNKYPDFALDIKAYTDDIGSEEYNRQLAKRRAAAIADFFKDKGIEPSTKNIVGLGELALKGEGNIAEERRKNRRVNIEITPFAPKDMNEFYSFFGQRNTQGFQLKNNKDVTIVGNKGTVLFIPKNSLQTIDGQDLNDADIVLEMREAYSYQDMLLENLGTVSNGKMLETGGMVHLAAKTTDGKEVVVKPGAELSLSMPSTGPLPEGMQLFVANRDINNPSAEINWEATQKLFVQPKGISLKPLPHIGNITKKHDALGELDFPIINDLKENQPLRPEMPIKLKPKAVAPRGERPTEATILAANAQQQNETKGKYKKRIERLLKIDQMQYDGEMATYERQQKRDAEALQNYEKAMKDYEALTEQYLKDFADYQVSVNIRKGELEAFRAWIKENPQTLYEWVGRYKNAEALTKSGEVLAEYLKGVKDLTDTRNYMVQEAQRAGLSELAEQIDRLYLNIDSVQLMVSKLGKTVVGYRSNWVNFEGTVGRGYYDQSYRVILNIDNNEALCELNRKLSMASTKLVEIETFTRSFNYLAQNEIFQQVETMVNQLKEVQRNFVSVNELNRRKAWLTWWEELNYDNFSESEKTQYSSLAFEAREKMVLDLIKKQEEAQLLVTATAWEKRYFETLTVEEKADYTKLELRAKVFFIKNFLQYRIKQAQNAIGISSLGWINCDRFRTGDERMQLVTKSRTKADVQVNYYICFKDIRAVMTMYAGGENEVKAFNIPKNQNVTIVGIAVSSNGEVALSKTEGKVAELHDKPLNTFVSVKLADLQALF